MKNIFFYLLAVFSIVVLFGLAYSFPQEKALDGKKVFEDQKCNSCHTVEVFEITSKNKKAVDISTTGTDRTEEFFIKYLNKEEKINDVEHKTKFKGTAPEMEALAKWLVSLQKKSN